MTRRDYIGILGDASRALALAAYQRDDAVHQAHAAGLPIAQIARAVGLSRQGVYDILKRKES